MRNIPLFSLLLASVGGITASTGAEAAISFLDSPRACITGLRSDLQPAPGADVRTVPITLSYLDPPVNGRVQVGQRAATIKIWQIACGGEKSALLARIEDSRTTNGRSNLVFPDLQATAPSLYYGITAYHLDTGTKILSGTTDGIGSTVVLDSYFNANLGPPNTNLLYLQVSDSLLSGSPPTIFDIPIFVPQAFPDSVGPRPINGRYAGNFYDPSKPGEGMVVEIGDVVGTTDEHFLQFAWHSFDNNGAPFWISGGTSFTGQPRHLRMPASFRQGGNFGGARPAQTQTAWGSVDIEFTNCGTAVIDYNANTNLPPNVPAGSGHLQWTRLTSVSGYFCD